MAAVELMQCKQLVWVVKLYTTLCIIYTTGYTTVQNIHPLSKPSHPLMRPLLCSFPAQIIQIPALHFKPISRRDYKRGPPKIKS